MSLLSSATVRRVVKNFGKPRFVITDHGTQFRRQFRSAMKKLGIIPVQARVRAPYLNGKIERASRTFRVWWRLVLTGLTEKGIQRRLDHFRAWFNESRPHGALHGLTPQEAWEGHVLPTPVTIRARDQLQPQVEILRRHYHDDPRLPVIKISVRLLGELIDVPGLKGCEVKLDGAGILPQLRFSADGRHVFILEKAGVLRKLTFPGMERTGQLVINSRCSGLSESKAGLVITLGGKEEVWIVDPETLAVSKQIKIDLVSALAACPTSDIAWARIATSGYAELAAIDLRAGKVLRQAKLSAWGAIPKTYQRPGRLPWPGPRLLQSVSAVAETRDGKYLIVSESGGQFCRYRIQDATLVPEEAQWLSEGNLGDESVTISDDGQYVSTWFRDRTVFTIADFSKPVIKGPTAPSPRREVLAFDRLGQKLYAGGSDRPTLWTINAEGQLEKEFFLGNGAGDSMQILVHPDGGELLLLTDRKLYRLELVEAAGSEVASRPGGADITLAGRRRSRSDRNGSRGRMRTRDVRYDSLGEAGPGGSSVSTQGERKGRGNPPGNRGLELLGETGIRILTGFSPGNRQPVGVRHSLARGIHGLRGKRRESTTDSHSRVSLIRPISPHGETPWFHACRSGVIAAAPSTCIEAPDRPDATNHCLERTALATWATIAKAVSRSKASKSR